MIHLFIPLLGLKRVKISFCKLEDVKRKSFFVVCIKGVVYKNGAEKNTRQQTRFTSVRKLFQLLQNITFYD